ncbi:unnamed protein product [Leptosia nina]|uniref:FERM domain-containing protein n=1 Tax=Leptosia nina TaxID=320188 RepID=A0AAV1JDD2_9NEOP
MSMCLINPAHSEHKSKLKIPEAIQPQGKHCDDMLSLSQNRTHGQYKIINSVERTYSRMAPISLKIVLEGAAVTKTLLFDLNTTISQAHHIVRDKIHSLDPDKEYGFFLPSADNDCSGVWLEGYRTFEYYMLREGDSLFYLEKVRNVRLRMLDGSVKTIQVDESKCVGDLMVSICEKIGTTNYEEYGLCREHMETEEAKPMTGTLTLRKKTLAREKDAELQQLSKKLKTDDNVEWLDQHKTLRELLVDPKETLLFKRRLFYSDRKVDARDPVQLNLLYVQTRDAILDGRQIVTEQKAVEFAGLQCQIQYEDFIEDKHKPGFIENLREFLPAQYATSWGIEKKIFKEHKKHHGLSQLEAKQLYTKTARELPTYGVTFFLVKEKHKGKKKLIPRLLGINSESVLRLDEETKEILQVWPLTQVKSYRAASESFTLDFGDYSDKEYAVKTNEAFRIKDILQGYIDIIRKKTAPPYNVTYTEGEAMCEDTVEISRGTIIQNIVPSKIVEQSFVGPSRIISVEQGHNTSEGVRITTVHEMVTVNQGDKSQHGMKGEILGETPDMFGKRLNRINSLAVKAVMLSDEKNNLSGLQGIASNMENELPAVVKGVRERAKQLDDEHSKKLLDELDELCDYINNLSITVKSSDYDSPEKLLLTNETAKKLADISALMYLSLDPKTKKRSQLIKSSRNSFIADEKTEAHLRRLSLKSSIAATHQVLDNAYSELGQEYIGSAPGPQVIETIEKSINYKLGKLNAAVALLLNAHSDPQEVNYATAVTCMSTIKELIPELIQDVNTLNSFTEGDEERTALTSQVKLLLDRLAALCCLNGTDDPQKIQDAGKAYGDESRKLIYTFNRGVQRDRTVDKESEIMNLAKNGSGELDDAGVKCADAAKELYACAQLTAPSINEPHCQSALTEACENLSSSVSHLTHTYKPIVDDPGRHYYGKRLNDRVADLNRELLRLKDAYINLSENNNGNDESYNLDDGDISAQRRLKFKALITRGKKALSEAENHLDPNSQSTSVNNGVQTQIDVESLQSLLNRKIGQLNSAVANLIKESISDEPDYEVYNRAISYISKLTPEIMRDAKILEDNVKELNGDNSTKHEVLDNLQTILNTVNDIAFGEKDVNKTDLYDAADNFVKSTHKLYWTFNPRHKTEEDNMLMDQAKDVGDKTSALLIDTSELISSIGSGPRAEELEGAGVRCADAAKAFIICAELTTPTIKNPYSQAVLESSVDNLESSIENLTDTYTPIVEEPERYYYGKTLAARNEALMKALEKLRCIYEKEKSAAVRFPNEDDKGIPDEEKAQRLKFIASISRLNFALQDAEEKLLVGSPNTVIYNEADLQEIQTQSSNNLARLNAAIASLLKSLSGIPDYEKTNAAISAIAELTPEIIRDGKIIENHVDGYEKEALIDNLEAMVEAAKDICTHSAAHNDTDLKNAAMKFAKSSGKLTYIFNPHANLEKESEIIDLTNDVALKTSLLLRNLRGITSINPPPPEELISNVDRAILTCNDAVNDLKNCAKLTAPCIEELNCQCALSAACENLAAKLEDLVLTFKPMLEEPSRQRSAKTIVQNTVDVSVALAKLKTAYPFSTQEDLSNKPTEAIKSVATLSPMKKALLDAEQFFDDKHNINQHLGRQSGKPDVKLSLTRSIAEMNAAIATMLHATIEEPDYNFVETSMAKIANIIPSIVDDAAFMAYQNAEDTICQDIKPMFTSLININKDIEKDQLKGLNNSAMEFAKTSQKIYHNYSPQIDRRKEDQILDLSRGACRDASKLLTKVYQLAKELQDPVATELDNCGTGIVDTAQVFLTAAEVTAPSMMEPECQTAMVSLTDTFLSKIKNLENLWMPLTGTYQDLGDQLHKDSSILETTLNKMKEICVYNKDDEINKRREELVKKTLDAKEKIKEAEMLMVEDKLAQLPEPPLLEVVAIMTEKGCVEKKSIEQTKRFLCDKLAELNQYISTLVQAASDREAINHSQQGELVGKISEVTPETLKCILSTHKYLDEDTSRAMVEEARVVCGRTHDILTNIENENIEELNDAVSKYALSSGKLYYIFSPYKKAENAKEREVLQLVRSACERTSLMLSRVSRLAKMVDAKDAEPCDTIGVKLADAAQVLLSSAQLLAPSMRCDASRTVLSSSVNNVSDLATTLGNAWSLIIEQDELGEQLDKDLADLQSDLDKLKNILKENTQFAEETGNLQTENVDNFVTDDVAKTSDIDVKIEDTPLKELAMKILKSAKSDLESKTLSPEEHTALQTFTNELTAAICALDLATARCKSDLLDPKKRQHLENVVQNLQHICLVSRQNGDEQSYIIDLMEFVKHVTSAADDLYQTTAYVEQDRCKKALTSATVSSSRQCLLPPNASPAPSAHARS